MGFGRMGARGGFGGLGDAAGRHTGAAVALSFLRAVTPRNSGVNPGGLTASGASNTFAFEVPVQIANDCADLVFSFSTKGITNGGDVATGNTISVLDFAVEAVGLATGQVKFSGINTTTIADSTIDFQSDALLPFGGRTKFSRGEIYILKLVTSCPAGGHMPYANNAPGSSVSRWKSVNFNPANTTVSAAATAGAFTFTGTTPGNLSPIYSPIVLGHPFVDVICPIGVGDSEIASLTDTNINGLINGNGFFQRSLTDSDGVSNPRPGLLFAVSGQGTGNTTGVNTVWQLHAKYANTGFPALNTNDIGGATTAAQAQALCMQIIQLMRENGIKRIMRPELFPNTTSTDNFVTTANQTPQSNWGPGQVGPLQNTYYAGRLNDGVITTVVSASDMRDPTIPTDWAVDGATSNLATPDGKHPSGAYHILHGTTTRTAWSTFPTTDPAPSVLAPVLDPFDKHVNVTLSNGNLSAINTASATQSNVRLTTAVKNGECKYFEVQVDQATGLGILMANMGGDLSTANNANILTYNANGGVFFNGQITPGLPAFVTGNRVCLQIDRRSGVVRLAARIGAGNWNGNVANDPAVAFIDMSGSNRFATVTDIYPGLGLTSLNSAATMVMSGFAQTVPSGASAITGGGV